jgi:hypothetical protein
MMWKGKPLSHIHRFPVSDSFDFQDWPLVARCTDDVLKAYPRLRLSHGRKVDEMKATGTACLLLKEMK